MVALPFRADQPANAKLAKERGLAEVLEPKKLGKRSDYPPEVLVLLLLLGEVWQIIDSKSAAILKKGTWRSSCATESYTSHIHTRIIYLYTDPVARF